MSGSRSARREPWDGIRRRDGNRYSNSIEIAGLGSAISSPMTKSWQKSSGSMTLRKQFYSQSMSAVCSTNTTLSTTIKPI